MHFMWFTERAYHYDPETDPTKFEALEDEVVRKRSFYGTPNSFFDRAHGAKLLNQYLDEKIYTDAELLNFDGIVIPMTFFEPTAATAIAAVREESIPPLNPTRTLEKPFL